MTSVRNSILLFAFVLCSVELFSQQLFVQADQSSIEPQAEFVIRVDREGARRIASTPVGIGFEMDVSTGPGKSLTLRVERFEVLAPTAPRRIVTSDGRVDIEPTPSLHLRGTVIGDENSSVIISVFDTWAVGKIETSSPFQQIILSPLERQNQHCVVATSDELEQPKPWLCGTDDLEASPVKTSKPSEQTQAGTVKLIELAVEGDYEYYLDHRQDEDRAIEYAESVIAAVSAIYERDVAAEIEISSIDIWTVVDPYPGTTSGAILGQFRTEWRNNNGNVERTLAHLFSGVNRIGGVAYLNALCSKNIGYAVSGLNNNVNYPRTTYAWDTDVTAHELGHNVGSRHTHSCTWNPPIDSCYDAEGDCFDTRKAKRGTIMSYCHLTNQGKDLKFHSQVSALMKTRLANAACVQTITDLVVSAGPDVSYCRNEEGLLRGSVEGGTPPLDVTWSPSTGLVDDSTLVQKVTSTTSRQYVLTIVDARGSRGVDTVNVTVHPSVTVSLKEKYDVCKADHLSITLRNVGGVGPHQYRWNSSEIDTTTTRPTLAFVPTADQLLTVSVIDVNGCGDQATTQVFVHEKPVASIDEFDETFCIGDTVRLNTRVTNSSPLAFEWYRNDVGYAIGQSSIKVSALVGDRFTVVVTNEVGCTDTAEVSLDVHDIRMSTQHESLMVPSIPPCDNTFQSWVTVLNEGADQVTLAEVVSTDILATIDDLPMTIEPGASKVIRIDFTITDGPVVNAQVELREATCGRSLTYTVQGEHGEVAIVEPDDAFAFNAVAKCEGEYLRHVEFPVLNTSGSTITITSARALSHDKTMRVRGNALIVAGEKAEISLEGMLPYMPSITRDSIVVSYEAQGCVGTIGFMVDVPYTTLSDELPAEIVIDRPVSPALEDIEENFSFIINSSSIWPAEVKEVTVVGPFSTSLEAGMSLETNEELQASVTFHPSRVSEDGESVGSITLDLDECYETRPIIIRAVRTVVSVDESELVQQKSDRVISNGRLELNVTDARVEVMNLKGELVLEERVVGQGAVDVSRLVPGLHVVNVREKSGKLQRFSILIR